MYISLWRTVSSVVVVMERFLSEIDRRYFRNGKNLKRLQGRVTFSLCQGPAGQEVRAVLGTRMTTALVRHAI